MATGRILVVEDEAHLANGLRFNLEAEGYQVDCVETGEEGLALAAPVNAPYDAIVLDIMLPGMDGFEVSRRLRAAERYLPVLMLTARGRSEDVLEGFAAGADDYLPKPFELSILLARVEAMLRRWRWPKTPPAPEIVEFAGRQIDFQNLELRWNDETLRLTTMEADLLRYLTSRAGTTVPRKEILEEVWGVHEDTDTRAVDNFVARLRKYIEDEPAQPRHLLTVRGVGYRFEL